MTERDPELDRLFRAARREEDPTDDDRRAVRHGLAARIASAAAAGAVATLSTRTAAAGIAKTTMLGWFGSGLAAGATVGAVVTASVVYSSRSPAPEKVPPSASAPSPRQSPSTPTLIAPVPVPVPETTTPAPATSETPAPTARIAASAAPSLEIETRALGDVQHELRDGRPDSALRLLDAQARTFANGVLHEERAAARVLALCAAGRLWEARRARQRFLETYPQSPSADRVRASCPR